MIESIGEGVSEFAKGDTVIPIFMPDCKECRDCKSKKSNLCTKYPFQVSPWLHDGTSRFTDLNGETIYHLLFVSSFAEYTVVDVANITKIDPATIPPNRACLLSCGVSTGTENLVVFIWLLFPESINIFNTLYVAYLGVGAALKSAKVKAGSTVAIFGLGSIGLAVRTHNFPTFLTCI